MFKKIYFYRARLFPALITAVPMLIFINKIIAVEFAIPLKNIYDILPLITHLGLSAAIIFLLVQINRFVAKEIFQRWYFRDELYMPTTNNLLMNNNTYYPIAIKNKIRDKILAKFQIELLSADEEQQNCDNARKLIVTAVSQIRNVLRGNEMLLQHNIEYGFWRNLIGGSLIALFFSAIIIWYGYSNNLPDQITIGLISFIVFLIPIILSKVIIRNYGKYYAKILYEEFLSLQ
ncbi:hypothetical protein ABID42_004710 [Arcicella rosea]|uniref:hypothetical protein n=1 Tax=Arcicella rosea TaxID=502909 RepID=UPI00345CD32A